MNETLIEINVGGSIYTTKLKTLLSESESFFTKNFDSTTNSFVICKDSCKRLFIDRDGSLFRFVLDYLRNKSLVLPANFMEMKRLVSDAEFYELKNLVKLLGNLSNVNYSQRKMSSFGLESKSNGCIIVGYRGTFTNGRDGLVDVKFRKISRILVCGRISLCREAFGDTLNESRDPDHGSGDRYTARYYLKHTFIEQAFDQLFDIGFRLVCAAATGANSTTMLSNEKDAKQLQMIQNDNEESRWLHYNEYVFVRDQHFTIKYSNQ